MCLLKHLQCCVDNTHVLVSDCTEGDGRACVVGS